MGRGVAGGGGGGGGGAGGGGGLTRCIMVYVKMVNTGISNFFAYFKFHSD